MEQVLGAPSEIFQGTSEECDIFLKGYLAAAETFNDDYIFELEKDKSVYTRSWTGSPGFHDGRKVLWKEEV